MTERAKAPKELAEAVMGVATPKLTTQCDKLAYRAEYERDQLEANKLVMSQLLIMANQSFRANQLAENTANSAKLAALRLREELKVRIEMINESLGIYPPEPEYAPTVEDARADDADTQNKERDEHETNPGAA